MNAPPIVVAIFFLALGTPAGAAPRTFVSGTGSDGNPCSLVSPCRTFATALAATDAGGEIVALDTAGYGVLTIGKAIAIIAPPGVHASVTVPTGFNIGITVAAGATDAVVLRGLTINGTPPFCCGEGIRFVSGGALHVENVAVNGVSTTGLSFEGAGELFIRDSQFRGNSIFIGPSTGVAFASIERSRVDNASDGLIVGDNARVVVRDSAFTGNFLRGVRGIGGTAGPSETTVEGSTLSGNGEGILSGSTSSNGAVVRVANSVIANNGNGLRTIGSNVLLTGGGNTLVGNTTPGSFTGSYAKQ